MGLWIIAIIVLVAFIILGAVSMASTSKAGISGRFTSAKKESLVTYEIEKHIRNRGSADGITLPALIGTFADNDAEYTLAKQIAFALVKEGYKIGDMMHVGALAAAPGAVLYVYNQNAERSDRIINAIGCIFLCKDDADFEKYSQPGATRFDRKFNGPMKKSNATRVSLHSVNKDAPTEWLDICDKLLSS